MSHQPGFNGLDEATRKELKDWGPDIFGTRDGFKMSGDMTHGSWSIKISRRKITFYPDYIEQQSTDGTSGFRVEKNPPAVILEDNTRIEPITTKEMMQAVLNPHRRGRSPER